MTKCIRLLRLSSQEWKMLKERLHPFFCVHSIYQNTFAIFLFNFMKRFRSSEKGKFKRVESLQRQNCVKYVYSFIRRKYNWELLNGFNFISDVNLRFETREEVCSFAPSLAWWLRECMNWGQWLLPQFTRRSHNSLAGRIENQMLKSEMTHSCWVWLLKPLSNLLLFSFSWFKNNLLRLAWF